MATLAWLEVTAGTDSTAGADRGVYDESYPGRFEPTIAPHASGTFKVLPGVTHLGLVVNPRTGHEIEAWLGTLP